MIQYHYSNHMDGVMFITDREKGEDTFTYIPRSEDNQDWVKYLEWVANGGKTNEAFD